MSELYGKLVTIDLQGEVYGNNRRNKKERSIDELIVANGAFFPKGYTHVRFNPTNNPGYFSPLGNAIGTQKNHEKYNMKAEDFVLLGVWDESMFPLDDVYTLNQVNRYFDPGKMGWVHVMMQSGNIRVLPTEKKHVTNVSEIVGNLPSYHRSARVILAENEDIYNHAVGELERIGLRPVRMDKLNIPNNKSSKQRFGHSHRYPTY